MSLSDDVFDVKDALDGKPEAKAFERIETALWEYEERLERHQKIMNAARAGFWALQEVAQEGSGK